VAIRSHQGVSLAPNRCRICGPCVRPEVHDYLRFPDFDGLCLYLFCHCIRSSSPSHRHIHLSTIFRIPQHKIRNIKKKVQLFHYDLPIRRKAHNLNYWYPSSPPIFLLGGAWFTCPTVSLFDDRDDPSAYLPLYQIDSHFSFPPFSFFLSPHHLSSSSFPLHMLFYLVCWPSLVLLVQRHLSRHLLHIEPGSRASFRSSIEHYNHHHIFSKQQT
jgi:hypothetical protein